MEDEDSRHVKRKRATEDSNSQSDDEQPSSKRDYDSANQSVDLHQDNIMPPSNKLALNDIDQNRGDSEADSEVSNLPSKSNQAEEDTEQVDEGENIDGEDGNENEEDQQLDADDMDDCSNDDSDVADQTESMQESQRNFQKVRGGRRGGMSGRVSRGRGRGGRGRRARGGRWGGRWANRTNITDGAEGGGSSPVAGQEGAEGEGVPPKVREKGVRGRKPNSAPIVEAHWVACDSCGKWRRLPGHINVERDLPDVWRCSMNSWDPARSSCDADEDTYNYVETPAGPGSEQSGQGSRPSGRSGRQNEDESPAAGNDGAGGGRAAESDDEASDEKSRRPPGRGRGRGRGRWSAPRSPLRESTSDNEGGAAAPAGRRGGRRPGVSHGQGSGDTNNPETAGDEGSQPAIKRGGPPKQSDVGMGPSGVAGAGGPGSVLESVSWVQCNRCEKWRKVPLSVDVDSLPEVWVCRQNFWDPAFARCNAKEETEEKPLLTQPPPEDEEGVDGSGIGAPSGMTAGPGRGRYARRKPGVDAAQLPAPILAPGGQPIKKVVTQWVQCERVSCKKWRKIPGHVDMSTLPERWFCEMNKWDVDHANCDDAEESDDSDVEGAPHGGDGRPVGFASTKGPGRLSYRRIIFGTDGRVRPAYSEKNKSGFGVFSFTDSHRPASQITQADSSGFGNDYVEPTRRVGYWWSSVYDEAGQFYTSSSRRGASTLGAGAKRERESADAMANATNNASSSMDQGAHGATDAVASGKASSGLYNYSDLSRVPVAFDCLRRFMGLEPDPPACIKLKKRFLNRKLSLLERMVLECRVVVSCLAHLGTVVIAPTSFGDVSPNDGGPFERAGYFYSSVGLSAPDAVPLTSLLQFMNGCRFHDKDLEYCRSEMDIHSLRAAVRRLELDAEIDVTYNSHGQIALQLFGPSVQHPSAERRPVSDLFASLYGDPPKGPLQNLSQTPRPLKLRKLKYLKNIMEIQKPVSESSVSSV